MPGWPGPFLVRGGSGAWGDSVSFFLMTEVKMREGLGVLGIASNWVISISKCLQPFTKLKASGFTKLSFCIKR